ncbi:alginate O-acetyltransferase AlgX-related protein [Labrys monachus]|uniref:AlgX/AlgJ SGNH hydrolase-like domain-containing protein n=1 Tax=Labrys monachus TaxID=217067 RepID=A0ABU0FEU8_9HYPH|nr:hypothetical protein [Labrys monachus]MDQ0392669.1 hypothetical protein [Labrys monachus]
MAPRTGRTILIAAFFAALLVPVFATVLSPGFLPFIRKVLAGDHSMKIETELLRRATPLWKGGADFYNDLLFKLGISPNPDQLMMGRDGYMFLGNAHNKAYDEDLRRYDAPASDLEKWVDDLAGEQKYLSDRGICMFFIVAPSKGTIYFDKLGPVPPGFADTPTLFDRVLAIAEKRGVSILDVRSELIAARETADTYSPLNSHWTDYGGYVAWQKIASIVGGQIPGIRLAGTGGLAGIGRKDYGNEAADLLSLAEPNIWTYPIYKQPFPTYYVVGADGTQTPVPGGRRTEFKSLPVETSSPAAPNPQRVLVITDSMGAALSPYWTASFRHVKQVVNHVRPPKDPLHFEQTVDDYRPDIVFYVMVERYFAQPLRWKPGQS